MSRPRAGARGLGMGARERDRLHDAARRNLVKAAAALDTYEAGGLALALYSTGVALYRIAQLDEDRTAYDRVQRALAVQMTPLRGDKEKPDGDT